MDQGLSTVTLGTVAAGASRPGPGAFAGGPRRRSLRPGVPRAPREDDVPGRPAAGPEAAAAAVPQRRPGGLHRLQAIAPGLAAGDARLLPRLRRPGARPVPHAPPA